MKVLGHTITDEQINAALAAMTGTFAAREIEVAFESAGVSTSGAISMRAADRLLQRERKAGNIRTVPGHRATWESLAA